MPGWRGSRPSGLLTFSIPVQIRQDCRPLRIRESSRALLEPLGNAAAFGWRFKLVHQIVLEHVNGIGGTDCTKSSRRANNSAMPQRSEAPSHGQPECPQGRCPSSACLIEQRLWSGLWRFRKGTANEVMMSPSSRMGGQPTPPVVTCSAYAFRSRCLLVTKSLMCLARKRLSAMKVLPLYRGRLPLIWSAIVC